MENKKGNKKMKLKMKMKIFISLTSRFNKKRKYSFYFLYKCWKKFTKLFKILSKDFGRIQSDFTFCTMLDNKDNKRFYLLTIIKRE